MSSPNAMDFGPEGASPLQSLILRNPRVSGLVMIALGLALVKFYMFDVLAAAQAGQNVTFSFMRPILGTSGFLIGLANAVGGLPVTRFMMGPRGSLRPKQLAVALVIVGIGLSVTLWLQATVRSYGYDV